MSFTENLKNLINIYSIGGAMEVIEVMLTQEIETIEELNDCIIDELSYTADSN